MADMRTHPYLEDKMTSEVVIDGVLYHLLFEGDGQDYTCTVKELNYSRPWGFSSDMISDEEIVREGLHRKPIIKLMWDYHCSPLWWADDKIENIDPETLPLSESLIKRLWAWADIKDKTLNPKDPSKPYPQGINEKEFLKEQQALLVELGKELPNFTIIQ